MLEVLASNPPGVFHWLVLSSLLFSIGVYGMLSRRNAIGVLMGVELALNSGALNFVLFNRLLAPATVDGEVMSIFIVTVAAAEAVVGMAIFVLLFKQMKTVDMTQASQMRH
ncbi:MAG: NADH-quinone oxidoreductase subunit NuoK [Deltaproteobacteria bacterium]|nr:NADH-quinone oxidoreductase subunit NuoK [Deltaproteobacteria bacterium]